MTEQDQTQQKRKIPTWRGSSAGWWWFDYASPSLPALRVVREGAAKSEAAHLVVRSIPGAVGGAQVV